MPLLQALRHSDSALKWSRALIVLLVMAIHVLLLNLMWQALRQPLPNRPSSQVASPERLRTITFLLEPHAPAAIKPRRDDPRLEARSKRPDPVRDEFLGPVDGIQVSNAAALADAVEPVIHEGSALLAPSSELSLVAIPSTPSKSASAPLALNAGVMRSAVAQGKVSARKLVEISGQQVNKLKPTQNEKLAATIAEAGVPDCVRFLKFDPPAIESEESTRQLLSQTRGPSSGREVTMSILPTAELIYAAATGKCKF